MSSRRTRQIVHVLRTYVNRRVRSGAEVGVWRGQNAAGLLARLPWLREFYLVDSYTPDTRLQKMSVEPVAAYEEALALMQPYETRCHWLLCHSVVAAGRIVDHSLDFAFIDASHSYPDVKADIAAWTSKIRPGGVLCGHDYHPHHSRGVKRAVDRAFGSSVQNDLPSRVWWVLL